MSPPQPQQIDPRAMAREIWSDGDYDAFSSVGTVPIAPALVRFAGVKPGDRVLDVGCGPGAVAITAHQAGAQVTGLDITPALLHKAVEHAEVAGIDDIEWIEGDVTEMQLPDATFDVVLSQFGHMFAPDTAAATREMLRVLKPGGTIAFNTWPPEHFVGRMFAITAAYAPPPGNAPSPILWGDPATIRERLGPEVTDVCFRRGTFQVPALSAAHLRNRFEGLFGPMIRTVQTLSADPARLASWRREWDAVAEQHREDNAVRHDYLTTRATKA